MSPSLLGFSNSSRWANLSPRRSTHRARADGPLRRPTTVTSRSNRTSTPRRTIQLPATTVSYPRTRPSSPRGARGPRQQRSAIATKRVRASRSRTCRSTGQGRQICTLGPAGTLAGSVPAVHVNRVCHAFVSDCDGFAPGQTREAARAVLRPQSESGELSAGGRSFASSSRDLCGFVLHGLEEGFDFFIGSGPCGTADARSLMVVSNGLVQPVPNLIDRVRPAPCVPWLLRHRFVVARLLLSGQGSRERLRPRSRGGGSTPVAVACPSGQREAQREDDVDQAGHHVEGPDSSRRVEVVQTALPPQRLDLKGTARERNGPYAHPR